MGTHKLFEELITKNESDILDFKSEFYKKNDKNDRAAFTKDIVAMANTPRTGSSYIVIGILEKDGNKEFQPLSSQIDDVEVQDMFLKNKVDRVPQFIYHPVEYKNNMYGIIEIKLDLTTASPMTFTTVADKVTVGVVYYRQGSKNSEATGTQLSYINDWFRDKSTQPLNNVCDRSWSEFFDAVDSFNYQSKDYVLIVGNAIEDYTDIEILGRIKWKTIIDFDRLSENGGLYEKINETIKTCGNYIHIDDSPRSLPHNPGMLWYFASGTSKQPSTYKYTVWRQNHLKDFEEQVQNIAKDLLPSYCNVIIYGFNEIKFIRAIVETFGDSFNNKIKFIYIGDSNFDDEFQEDYDYISAEIKNKVLFNGLNIHFNDLKQQNDKYYLPMEGDTYKELNTQDYLWLSEDFEILYRDIANRYEPIKPDEYRKGHEIKNENLMQGHDCMRDESKKIERRIATDLDQHLTTRVNLYHEPGAGGTTVSKRIAWSLFQSYPVCILKHYSSDSTYRKIAKIVNETNKSVLVIIERSLFSESEIDDFYEKLKAESISAVLFQVIRKFELSKEDKNTEKSRIFYLKENLSPFEMNTFKVTYLNDLPRKKDKIEKYAESLSQKTAFLFGLNAYDDEYIGIENYVQARFENLTETQKRLFVFLSFVEYYAQTGLLIECVDSLLGRESQNNNIKLNHFFNNNPYHSLDMIEILPRELKIIHFAIAKKIFEFFYGENWKNQLVIISIEFIDKCSDNSQAISNKVMKLIKKIFIVLKTSQNQKTHYNHK